MDRKEVLLTDRRYCGQTGGTVDRQEVLLTERRYC